MPPLIVFEDEGYRHLLPLIYWRTTSELRCGPRSLFDHVRACRPDAQVTIYCRSAQAPVAAERLAVPVNLPPEADEALLINARLITTDAPVVSTPPAVQWHGDTPVVIHADRPLLERLTPEVLLCRAATRQILADVPQHEFLASPRVVDYPWQLLAANHDLLERAADRTAKLGQVAGKVHAGAHLVNRKAIHVGPGSVVKPGAVLDADAGPIVIGADVSVSAHAVIEGPCCIGDGSLVRSGAVLHGGVSIGPCCKIGGEIEASIIHGFANKQHDGFLGHAYVGAWVNIGADTVNSDLKNTYGTVRVPINGVEVDSGETFVGAVIGDHSKTGIGQLLPAGATIGFGCNVANGTMAPKYVASFTWLTPDGASLYDLDRCLAVARRVMARRQVTMTAAAEALFRDIATQAREHEASPGRA
jgi:UDP-N-acetylglucosamine diphosphorylase/glucosamine-1-phosphate N-acetyltransferase